MYRKDPTLSFCLWRSCFPSTVCLRLFLPHCVALAPLLKIIWSFMWRLTSGLSILFHWCMCLLLHRYHSVLITVTLWWNLISRSVRLPNLVSLSKIILALKVLSMRFHKNFGWDFLYKRIKILKSTILNL